MSVTDSCADDDLLITLSDLKERNPSVICTSYAKKASKKKYSSVDSNSSSSEKSSFSTHLNHAPTLNSKRETFQKKNIVSPKNSESSDEDIIRKTITTQKKTNLLSTNSSDSELNSSEITPRRSARNKRKDVLHDHIISIFNRKRRGEDDVDYACSDSFLDDSEEESRFENKIKKNKHYSKKVRRSHKHRPKTQISSDDEISVLEADVTKKEESEVGEVYDDFKYLKKNAILESRTRSSLGRKNSRQQKLEIFKECMSFKFIVRSSSPPQLQSPIEENFEFNYSDETQQDDDEVISIDTSDDLDENLENFIDDTEENTNVSVNLPLILNPRFGSAVFDFENSKREAENAEYFRMRLTLVDRKIQGFKNSLVTSTAWHPDFKNALDTYPLCFTTLSRPNVTCEACRRTGHPASRLMIFHGYAYDRSTLQDEVNNSDSDNSPRLSHQNQNQNQPDDQVDTNSELEEYSDDKSNENPDSDNRFLVGRFCYTRALIYHSLHHFMHRFRRIVVKAMKDISVRTGLAFPQSEEQILSKRDEEKVSELANTYMDHLIADMTVDV
ncbi:Proline-rich protein 12, partial [Nowakowskiella sp. JEL0078]